MDLGLAGKAVLVSGGARGIGHACARAFLAEGARVAIVSRTEAHVEQALRQTPGLVGTAADLCDEAEALRALSFAEAEIGPIDILVNSAGAARRTPPDELTPMAWKAAMDAKFFSYVNLMDPVVKKMAARGQGVILNIIGTGGKRATPTHLPGGAANSALMLATVGLGAAYANRGVRVVGLSPGMTKTDRVEDSVTTTARDQDITEDEAMKQIVASIPMGRLTSPDEVAAMAVFLASGRVAAVTGTVVTIDGGEAMAP